MANAGNGTVVIGIGNPDRGDDGAGRIVAQRLRGVLSETVGVGEQDGEATTLLAAIDGADVAVLIDACVSGGTAGTIHRFDVATAPLPQTAFSLSTHGLGLGEAVELARALGQLPRCCIVYAIEAGTAEAGVALSPAVANAVDQVVERVRAEIDGVEARRGQAHA
jgi:hydrogenase maturation protease